MRWTSLAVTLLSVLGLSVGQVLFKIAASHMLNSDTPWIELIANRYLWFALVIYGVSTLLWIAVLREVPLRLAYPLVGSAFLIVPLLAHFFLGEPLHWKNMAGSALIAIGIYVATFGEIG